MKIVYEELREKIGSTSKEGMGEYNKMYNFTISEAVDSYNVKMKADIAYENLMKESNENSNIQ